MSDYKLTRSGIQRLADGANIPIDFNNRDYQSFLAWKNAGNVPEPASILMEIPVSLEVAAKTPTVFDALVQVLAAHFGISVDQLMNEIKAQV